MRTARWDVAQPIHVIATFDEVPPPHALVRGTLRTGSLAPVRAQLDSLRLADELIVIYVGSKPVGLTGAGVFFALMLFGAFVAWSVILSDIRAWRRARVS